MWGKLIQISWHWPQNSVKIKIYCKLFRRKRFYWGFYYFQRKRLPLWTLDTCPSLAQISSQSAIKGTESFRSKDSNKWKTFIAILPLTLKVSVILFCTKVGFLNRSICSVQIYRNGSGTLTLNQRPPISTYRKSVISAQLEFQFRSKLK